MQFESSHPFKVPKPPPNKLVRIKSFIVPNISSFPAMPNEKFPPKMNPKPSKRKFEIGMINISETIKDEISNGFKSIIVFLISLIRSFKKSNNFYYVFSLELNLQRSN